MAAPNSPDPLLWSASTGHSTGSAKAAHAPPPIPDHRLACCIGRGSYGEVWLALNIMGTPRAVKIVYREGFERDRPFEREFRGLQQCEPISRSHEGLMQILHVGRHEPSQSFFCVMELADDASAAEEPGGSEASAHLTGAGECFCARYRPKTLRSELARRGRLPLEECVSLAISLASALGHLHQHGLVHRDLKPSNIIYVNGRPKVGDIGLVTAINEAKSFVGTEGFVPPQGPGTPHADLYALGKVLYEASTGLDRLQFPQLPTDWLDAPNQALFEFNEVLLKACDTDSSKGYQSAEEMQADLALLRAGKSVRRLHSLERRVSAAKRFGWMSLAVALLAVAAYGLAQRNARQEREARRRVERAEQQTIEQLFLAQLAQAHAVRHSGASGQRFEALALAGKAAAWRPSVAARNEAVAAFALRDLRSVAQISPPVTHYSRLLVDRGGERYAFGDEHGKIHIHRVVDNSEAAVLPGSGQPVREMLGFSPDGRHLAVLASPQRLAVWDVVRGVMVLAAAVEEQDPNTVGEKVDFLPDSAQLLACGVNSTLCLYDLAKGSRVWTRALDRNAHALKVAPNGRQLALACSEPNEVVVIDLASGLVTARLPQTASIDAFQWHPQEPWLAVVSGDNRISLWDTVTRHNLKVFPGHPHRSPALAFHPSGTILASSGWDDTTRLWDIQTGREEVVLPLAGDQVRFSGDGQRLTFIDFSGGFIHLCEVEAETVCRCFQLPREEDESNLWGASFSPCGRWIATTDPLGIRLIDAQGGNVVALLPFERPYSCFFDRDGGFVCGAGGGGLARWSVLADESGAVRTGPPEYWGAAAPGNRRACRVGDIVAWARNAQVAVQKEGRALVTLEALAPLDHVAMSPDGRWLAAAAYPAALVHLWDTVGWRRQEIPVDTPVIVAFTPESRYLMIGAPKAFSFIDLNTGQRNALPRRQASSVPGPMAFSPDGKTMAIASSRTLIALHEYPSLRELASLESPHGTTLDWLEFDAKGEHLAVAGAPNRVLVWDLHILRQKLARMGLDW